MVKLRQTSFSARIVRSTIVGCAALTSLASPAAAQTEAEAEAAQPMRPALGMAHVRLSAGEHAFRVFFGRGQRPIAACRRSCEFWAWPGRYRVRVSDGEAPHMDAIVPLDVAGTGSYAFVPANGKSQNAGLLLGASGPVIGVAGLGLTTVGLLTGCDQAADQSCARSNYLYFGLGAMGIGAGMTTTGWLMYAYNRARFRSNPAAPFPTRPSLALAPMREAALGVAAILRF